MQLEWSLGPNEVSLEIDLTNHTAEWRCLDLTTDASDAKDLDLNTPNAWNWLVEQLKWLESKQA